MDILKEAWDKIEDFLLNFGWKFVETLSYIIIGFVILKIILKIIRKFLYRSPIESTLCTFIYSIIKFGLYILYVFTIASKIGIPMTSFVTILAAVSLAIGLAVQGSLSNFANGVVLIFTRPFKEGDYVEIAGIGGTVKAIRMLSTQLVTPDNKVIIIPNSNITGSNIVNYYSNPTRRLEFNFDVAHGSDIETVKKAVLEVFSVQKNILKDPSPTCRLNKLNPSSLSFVCRVHVYNEYYWITYFDVMEQVIPSFEKYNIHLGQDIMNVKFKKERNDTDEN